MGQRNILNTMWGSPAFKGDPLREDWELQRLTPSEPGGSPGRAWARTSSSWREMGLPPGLGGV